MNLLPLCTANVCPTNSGSTVLARDHVLITRFSLREFMPWTRLSSASCTNGPFLTERPMRFLYSLCQTVKLSNRQTFVRLTVCPFTTALPYLCDVLSR